MRKIMMGTAVLALLATGCQNEVLVEQSQSQEGQLFTLEVGRGFESRTVLNDDATHWSEDDAIYVSGVNGKVHGELKFAGYGENKSIAKFSGLITGGMPEKLEHIVFPAPKDGKIDMSARTPGKLDAPMIGTINPNGTVQTLNNVGGLLAFKMIGGEGNVYGVSATEGINNMTGGYYTFNAEKGTLDYYPVDKVTPAMVMEDGYVYVPVATTTDETDGTGAKTEVTVDVTVTNLETESTVIEGKGVEITSGDIMGDNENEDTGLDTGVIEGEEGAVTGTIVSTLAELETAIKNGENVVFANDIKGDLTIEQKPDVQIAINGNNKKFFGAITVDGKSATYKTAGLTIKNLNFKAESISADACINMGNGTNATRYICNLTVEGCTFDVPGAVGVKSYTGGDHNLSIKDCVVSENMHSLAQLDNVETGLKIIGCEVYSKNGVNLNQTPSLYMDDCTFDVRGYAVRFGVNGTVGGSTKSFEIVNSTLESACEEKDDAVIIFRDSAKEATLVLTNTTLIGAREFIGAEGVTLN